MGRWYQRNPYSYHYCSYYSGAYVYIFVSQHKLVCYQVNTYHILNNSSVRRRWSDARIYLTFTLAPK